MLAEAYNRMGDPTSQAYALMLLNDGVNAKNPKPAQFTRWSGNLGIRGRAYLKSRVVPEGLSSDSVLLLIEDYIMAERAMELAFEGKRWFDLVRIAERRNDPAFLADRVAAKFAGTGKYDEIHARLMNPVNWYLPVE
jgi:starch-binding outer membrane protein, SusD/RagB family